MNLSGWLQKASRLSLSQGLVFQQIHLKKKNKNTKFFFGFISLGLESTD